MPDFEPGPAGVRNFIRQVRRERTGIHVIVHDIFAEEDKVAFRFTLSMTDATSREPVSVQHSHRPLRRQTAKQSSRPAGKGFSGGSLQSTETTTQLAALTTREQ
jgi:hypothetical protein